MASLPAAESIKESLKETLLGSEAPEGVPSESRARFLHYASLEEEGQLFMSLDDFVNAIAPPDEDYVRTFYAQLYYTRNTDYSSHSTR